MEPGLENEVKQALLALRWKRNGEGPNPSYFVGTASDAVRLEDNAASFLAHFITERVNDNTVASHDDSSDAYLNKYSLEVIASYLEDHGYIVSSPE